MTPEDQRTALLLRMQVMRGELSWDTETFDYDVHGLGRWTWDVTAAKHILTTWTRGAWPIPEEVMENIARQYSYVEERLPMVDPAVPGIAVSFWYPSEQRRVLVLLDGTHHCVCARREGLLFHVFLLSEAELDSCLLSAPTQLRVAELALGGTYYLIDKWLDYPRVTMEVGPSTVPSPGVRDRL